MQVCCDRSREKTQLTCNNAVNKNKHSTMHAAALGAGEKSEYTLPTRAAKCVAQHTYTRVTVTVGIHTHNTEQALHVKTHKTHTLRQRIQ